MSLRAQQWFRRISTKISLQNSTALLVIIGTLSFIYWPRVFHPGFFIPIRFELVFLCAAVLFFIDLIRRCTNGSVHISQKEKKMYYTMVCFFISILCASAIAYFYYHLPFTTVGFTTLAKIALGFTSVLIIFDQIKTSKKFYKTISWALIIPTVALIPFLTIPKFAEKIGFVSDGYRFQGPTVNPGLFCFLASIAFCFLYSLFINSIVSRSKKIISIGYLFLCMGTSTLIFWSQFRSYSVAIFIIVIVITIIYGVRQKLRHTMIGLYCFIGSILIGITFFFTPHLVQKLFIYTRVFGIPGSQIVTQQPVIGAYPVSIENASKTIFSDPRITMWKYYIPLLLKNPLGLGVNYQPRFSYVWIYNNYTAYLPPIFIFNIWALGGIGALISFGYLTLYAFHQSKNTVFSFRTDIAPYRIGAIVAFFISLCIAIVNGIPVEYICFWIILALASVDTNQ